MKALINFADKIGINPTLLNAVEKTNQKQIQNIVLLMEKTLGILTSKRITVLGTAFKPNTDDVRDSIAIELIKKLLKKKSRITIYDPKAMKNTRNIFGEKIVYARSVTDALNKSQCVILMTHWKQFERFNNNSMKCMSKKFIIDCRRILVEKELQAEYHAIGIGKI
jgi:UDPglucose 6-dehydrogenase